MDRASVANAETFRIPVWPWLPIIVLLNAPSVILAALTSWPLSLNKLVYMIAMIGLFYVLGVLSISRQGLVLYRVNRCSWSEFTSAELRTVLGLCYLRAKRKAGLTWWIPLYFVGNRDVRNALRESAPEGNVIRRCLEPASSGA